MLTQSGTLVHVTDPAEVWEHLASVFSEPRATRRYKHASGLCLAVKFIDFADEEMRFHLMNIIATEVERHPRDHDGELSPEGLYGWALTDEGDRERVAFCRLQLALLGKKV